jgi:ribosomal protein S18 acetylase RimI-like enzyme
VTTAAAAPGTCLACDLTSGTRHLPGGRVHQTTRWVVEHCLGPLGLGTLVVKPLRHVLHVADLDEAESAELGPLLRLTSAAVTEVMQPEQVYVCLWSHAGGAPAHIHFVVQPVTEADKNRFGAAGPDLQAAMFRAGEQPGEDLIDLVCARLRGVLRPGAADVTVTPAMPGSAEGRAVLTAYFRDIVSRARGREATPGEVDAAMSEEPSDDLRPPGGLLLVARQGQAVVGCAGLRLLPDGLGEVTRVFVQPVARGRGVGSQLMHAVEDAARDCAVTRLRLDTRSDLTEARRLYTRFGYQEVAPFSDERYANLWFAKAIGS